MICMRSQAMLKESKGSQLINRYARRILMAALMATRGVNWGGASEASDAERFARLRLLRSPNIGPVSYYQLLRRFGSAMAALPALPALPVFSSKFRTPRSRVWTKNSVSLAATNAPPLPLPVVASW